MGLRIAIAPASRDSVLERSGGVVRPDLEAAFDPSTGAPLAGGLHDPAIFGAPDDTTRFGHFELPTPVLHPFFRRAIAERLGVTSFAELTHDERETPGASSAARAAGRARASAPRQDTLAALRIDALQLLLHVLPIAPRGMRRADAGLEHVLDHHYLAVGAAIRRYRAIVENGAPMVLVSFQAEALQQAVDRLFGVAVADPTGRTGHLRLESLAHLIETHRDDDALPDVLRACALDVR